MTCAPPPPAKDLAHPEEQLKAFLLPHPEEHVEGGGAGRRGAHTVGIRDPLAQELHLKSAVRISIGGSPVDLAR